MGYAFGAIICIAYGDLDGGNEDDHEGVRSAIKSGAYCATKTTSPNNTFALRVLQHPLRSEKQIRLNQIDHRAPFAQRKRQAWLTDTD